SPSRIQSGYCCFGALRRPSKRHVQRDLLVTIRTQQRCSCRKSIHLRSDTNPRQSLGARGPFSEFSAQKQRGTFEVLQLLSCSYVTTEVQIFQGALSMRGACHNHAT